MGRTFVLRCLWRYGLLWACGIALLWPQRSLAATAMRARLSDTEIYVGDSTTLELRIEGIQSPTLPELQLPDIDVTPAGGQSFNNTNVSVVNGRATRVEESGYIARYRLRPRRAGTLAIPPITVVHEGQTFSSQPLTLVVQLPQAQDYAIVEVGADKTRYVLGEQVTLTLTIALRKLLLNGTPLEIDPFFPENPPHLEISWFERLGEWKTTDIETFVRPYLGQQRPGFAINEYYDRNSLFRNNPLAFVLPRSSTTRITASGPAAYFTYQLRKQFQPLRSGTQMIPPVLLKASLPTRVDAQRRATQTQQVVASSAPFPIEVRPVPTEGQPVSFSGAVGRFRLQVGAEPAVLKVGDPLTLRLTLYGEPDSLFDSIRPPHLELQETLIRDWKVHTDPPGTETTADSKTFIYTLRPRHAEVKAVPPLEVAYFDSREQRFHTLQSDPIAVRVNSADTLAVSEVMVTENGQRHQRIGQALSEGILANYTGQDVLVPQTARLRWTLGGALLLTIPPGLYLLTIAAQFWRRRRQQYAGKQRVRKAGQQALERLQDLQRQAMTEGDTMVGEHIYRIIADYVRTRLMLHRAGLTVDDLTEHLQAHGLQSARIERITELLHRCDSIRYAPGNVAVTQLSDLLEEAITVLRQLEEEPWR